MSRKASRSAGSGSGGRACPTCRVPKMGPHKLPDISGPVRSYVLDGLQRLSTLFGALCPRDARTQYGEKISDWDIYYRLEDLDFSAGPAPSPVPDDWLPLLVLMCSPALLRFQRRMLQRHPERESWINAADSLQKVLLEYKIPVIPFVTDDLDRATLAFARINSHQNADGRTRYARRADLPLHWDRTALICAIRSNGCGSLCGCSPAGTASRM